MLVLVEFDLLIYNFDLVCIEVVIMLCICVLLLVYFYGLLVDMDVIYVIVKCYGLKVLDDCV